MKYILVYLFITISIHSFSQSNYKHWTWAKSFGGSANDSSIDMQYKNGFVYVTGIFNSAQINWEGNLLLNHGDIDIFLAKLDTAGNTIWVKNIGGAGTDRVKQLELNSSGALVINCTSNSQMIQIGAQQFNNPNNFYVTVDANGNFLQTVLLPKGPDFTDIDIDNNNNVYVIGQYFQPFIFKDNFIDSSYGLAGAAVLKYNQIGQAQWYTALQVRSNTRYEWRNYDDYNYAGAPPSPPLEYTPPITGNAWGNIKIEYNEKDTLLGFIGSFNMLAAIGNGFITANEIIENYAISFNGRLQQVQRKISNDGSISGAYFCDGFYTYSGYSIMDFRTDPKGNSYTFKGVYNLASIFYYTLTKERNNSIVKKLESTYNSNYSPNVPAIATIPFSTSETGNFLLCADVPSSYWPTDVGNVNAVLLDNNLNLIKRTDIAEIDQLPLGLKSMADTNAIFFASTFNGTLTLNDHIPNYTNVLPNNGMSEIFIGKYNPNGISVPQLVYPYKTNYKTCKPADTIQLWLNVYGGATPYTFKWQSSSHFSDTTILNPIVYVGSDSIINYLTITDGNGTQLKKRFVFFSGQTSNLQLVASNTNICSNDTLTLSLQGNNFEPVYVYGMPYQTNANYNSFTSLHQTIKYVPNYSQALTLYPTYDYYGIPSPYCILNNPIQINVRQAFVNTQNVYVCPGSNYTFNDSVRVQNIQQSFTHTIRHTNINGCDSNYVTNIIIGKVYNKIKIRRYCYGTLFMTNSGIVTLYNDTTINFRFNTFQGCDSIISFQISVTPIKRTTNNYTFCKGSNFGYYKDNYNRDTLYNLLYDTTFTCHFYTNLYQCDSFVTTVIKVAQPTRTSKEIFLCYGSNYTFPDGSVLQNITTAFTQTSRLTSMYGCDSIVITQININPVYSFVEQKNVCYGSSYTFPDSTSSIITTNIQHVSNLKSISNCDSIITTQIKVNPVYSFVEQKNVCYGSSYTFPDSTSSSITTNLQHVSNLKSISNCDSIITSNISAVIIDTTVTKSTLTLTSQENNALYKWLDCTTQQIIDGANTQSFTANSIGNYAVQLTKLGCIDTSSCYIVNASDLLIRGLPLINVYPNPTQDVFALIIQSERPTTVQLSMIDCSGNIVYKELKQLQYGRNVITKSIHNLNSGSYTLIIQNIATGEYTTKKIIKLQ